MIWVGHLRGDALHRLYRTRAQLEKWQRLGRGDTASGIDGRSWQEYGEPLDANLTDLAECLKTKRYKAVPVNYVIEADIKGFFDHVSHDWMMQFLRVRVRDSSLLLLIRRFLKAGYRESGHWHPTDEGTPQGGNLVRLLDQCAMGSR